MKKLVITFAILCFSCSFVNAQTTPQKKPPKVTISKGTIQGIDDSGVYIFKGIPFARPPVGNLRWKPPKPPQKWNGILQTSHFGNGCMQRPIFGDMNFRFPKKSEDCLYLNVWTPVKPSKMKDKHLPVLVYFYGGGFMAGDGSEYRYDGENMARTKGIVMVTANYRLSVFGFLATPGLTKESPHHASGNYGLMDQVQVLRWVKKNIADFGGDPNKVTIGGESAGSMSVSGLMASPLSKNLFRAALGESGGLFGPLAPMSLSEAEKRGEKFKKLVGAHSLAELRSVPASKLLKATAQKDSPRFRVDIDGYYLPEQPVKIFSAGKQAQVPLLLGWNSEESSWQAFLQGKKPTPGNFIQRVKKVYPDHAHKILKLFPHSTGKQVKQSATHLAGDRFTVFSTWKWSELQNKTGGHPVYRYYYTRPRPEKMDTSGTNPRAYGAVHSAEIEYVLGNLSTNRVYNWQPVDYKISRIFQSYVASFVKTGNPNGLGLPTWVPLNKTPKHYVMQIGENTYLRPSNQRRQLLYLDKLYSR
jgi:para-nitrobenzyl esterase